MYYILLKQKRKTAKQHKLAETEGPKQLTSDLNLTILLNKNLLAQLASMLQVQARLFKNVQYFFIIIIQTGYRTFNFVN